MIHAYLFISNIREGNGGHGPNFCRIMNNINKAAGTNISVRIYVELITLVDLDEFYSTGLSYIQ